MRQVEGSRATVRFGCSERLAFRHRPCCCTNRAAEEAGATAAGGANADRAGSAGCPGARTRTIDTRLGFKTKTLIQIGLSWSKASDEKMTVEQLFSNATCCARTS